MNFHLVINVSIVLIFGVLGLRAGQRLHSKNQNVKLETLHHQARYIYFIIAILLLVFIIIGAPMVNRTLRWQVPVWFDLYANDAGFRIVIACFAFLYTLVSMIAFKTGHKEKRAIAMASVMLIAIFPILHWQYSDSVVPELNHLKVKGVIIQSHPSTCVAASGANIAGWLGIEKTEKEMALRMRTTKMTGTNAGRAIHALGEVGVSCSKKWVKDSDITQLTAPAMLFIDNAQLGPETHAVAFMGMQEGKAEIWDPLDGKTLHSVEKVKTFWQGKSLQCSKSGNV